MRPLIVYCLSGGPYLRMVELSLQSLVTLGGYSEEVLIVCEESPDSVHKIAPTSSHLATTVRQLSFGGSSHSALLSRYHLHEHHPLVGQCEPVLYVDADILFDVPLKPMLGDLRKLDRIAVAAEQWTDRNRDAFMGAELIHFAKLVTTGFGLNSGTIGIPNGRDITMRERLLEVSASTRVFCRSFPNRLGHTHDQAALTFIDARDECFDSELLTAHIQFNGEPVHDPLADRCGMVHFLFDDKINRMRSHLANLLRSEPRNRWSSLFNTNHPISSATDSGDYIITSNNLW